MKIAVLGAGAWGTALAVQACGRHAVRLWARDPQQAAQMRSLRRNQRYLKDRVLPAALQVGADLDAALEHAAGGLVVIATPMAALPQMLAAVRERLPAGTPTLWLCKGLQHGSAQLAHEIAQEVWPGGPTGVLSGPSFALEVARGQPTALVAASADPAVCQRAVDAFHGDGLRVYTAGDVVGVEVGGAVKNVLAIATGIADGMLLDGADPATGLGLNARAALITRGLAEMTRFGLALGARPETFMGLSGLGDLVLTATGGLSRNRQVGLRLAQGQPLALILVELGHVAEGVHCARSVAQRAEALGVEMPITQAVVRVLEGRWSAAQALEALMGRDARPEH
ncbi:NAD(P)H-dependent glycerol-3-phosphate dehydrogenase [Piscinibacter sakaiensis]|uniref:Glycerol-3-phosphate dehydrogenase [NAD(P)+] n=1 Tax=Piscinibacter sakaiensis TaxID=1547922 RepID=A0A0K8P2D2_PISS1|nr:NAD(P)H-dependent glycerol-3-phosphate dehydrogenase [Piscinibacter sakaiensis]GAP36335.1 glycerol-3-phosphate dehydrogenase [NADP+] [Piscinibacter sakaiensis]